MVLVNMQLPTFGIGRIGHDGICRENRWLYQFSNVTYRG